MRKMLSKSRLIGIIAGVLIIAVSAILTFINPPILDIKMFYFIAGVAVIIAGFPFFVGLLVESERERDKEAMFLEFSRDLVEGVRSGTPISRSIMNVKNKDYGNLNPFVDKLANQIAMGIPVKDALDIFAREVKSPVISRAISLIREAEKSGGKIESILESVSISISQIEKLKKERKAAIYNLTVQGYIIFLIFIVIMLVMEFKILPMTAGLNFNMGDISDTSLGSSIPSIKGGALDAESFARPFLFLLLTQGFFSGLVIGKISEGYVKSGLKHSFIMVLLAWIISTGAEALILK